MNDNILEPAAQELAEATSKPHPAPPGPAGAPSATIRHPSRLPPRALPTSFVGEANLSTQAFGGGMSCPTDESDFLHELKVVVAIELHTADLCHSQHPRDLPVTEWLVDPTETEREQVGLRGILAAITELENGSLFPLATEDGRM
ncbi:hypothetical protein ACBI99_16340 [Nonomuraea sp. ATR24]|uniref:hypothetical protein n=1 Tax=Nonomuraea sp. ATR24 TaxID=1676744 RepID=UPI0035C1748C